MRGGYLLGAAVAESDVGLNIRREIQAHGFAIHEIDLTAYEPPRG